MKLKVLFIKKIYLYCLLIIFLILIIAFSLIFVKKAVNTFNSITDTTTAKKNIPVDNIDIFQGSFFVDVK